MNEKVKLTKGGQSLDFPKADMSFMIKQGWKEAPKVATPAPAVPAATPINKEVVKNG